MKILMMSLVIGCFGNDDDDAEPGNRIFLSRCLKWCTVGDFEQITMKNQRNSMGADKAGNVLGERDDYI